MTELETTQRLMRHALSLASHDPSHGVNPQVGCVLADAAGNIVAEGWHRGAGTPHAEVDALSKVADASGLTAIVTLEPCNHTGRTGPCSEALIAAGVSRVVFAVSDPGDESAGGASRLRDAGIEVEGGILADEVEEFIRPWLTAARLQRPFVTVKWASSLDGRAAADDGSSQWITGRAARLHVHEQRAKADAIVVGTGTVFADNPSLTARGELGELAAHQPIPVVVGERAIAADAKLHAHPAGVIETRSRDLGDILSRLFDDGVRHVFVEGGPTLASAFIKAGLADEFLIYVAPVLLGGSRTATTDVGVASMPEQKRLTITHVEQLGNDTVFIGRPATEPSQAEPAMGGNPSIDAPQQSPKGT